MTRQERDRRYREAHRDEFKAYRVAHRDELQAYQKAYRDAHRDKNYPCYAVTETEAFLLHEERGADK